MKKRFKILLVVSAVIVMCSCVMAAREGAKKEKERAKDDLYAQVELFSDAISIIRNDYVDEVDSKKMIYGALKGLLSSLDEFSQFMDPDEYKEIRLETKGEFGGIGIEISTKDGILTVVTPIASTPAEAAGIKAGDKIVKIDNKVTRDMTITEAVKMMRGEPGTPLALTIWREKEQKILEIPLKRDVIKINSIRKASLIQDKIGYVKLVEFQENTPRDLEEAIKKLTAGGMDSLILDLRNNPGGLLEVSVGVAEQFLPKDKTIVSIKSRTPEQNAVFKSSGKLYRSDYPLIVMVNEGSASASEIVAGAIQDNKRGLILGTKSYGKASVQTVIPLRDGSALRLTTASYYTPSGKMIRNQGIIPDVVVEKEVNTEKKDTKASEIFEKVAEKNQPSVKKDDVERDNQLEAAINLIKAIKVYRTCEQK